MLTARERVEIAIKDLQQGKMLILCDNPERENEGDLIIAAEKITAESMNFLIRKGTGIVCLSLTEDKLKQLDLPLMIPKDKNTCARGTQFTLTIDAKKDITTGVSAIDRVKAIEAVIADNASSDDYVVPGHIFPLAAKNGGALERPGHTEGSVDLMRLAGLKPAAVICEIMNPDGTMAQGADLTDFANTHQLNMLSIDDLIQYRLQTENFIADEVSCQLPIEKYGTFKMSVIKDALAHLEHVVLSNNVDPSKPVLVRIHSACTTGDCFLSLRCDCHHQLHYSLQRISEEGGILIYLNQEGRGIGLFNKIKAYALQEQGFDTVDANTELGLPVDAREYYIAANILRNHKINHVRLLTNNPDKMNSLAKYGIESIIKEDMPSFHHEINRAYLQVKKDKLAHTIDFKEPK